jgi:hypothetical protein
MRPGVPVELALASPPEVDVRRRAVAMTRAWLDSLGRAPTAEEVVDFAEGFNAEAVGR